jgi:hypothetical protein
MQTFWLPSIHSVNRGTKAALKPPQSKRSAKFVDGRQARQRLDCGGFSAALRVCSMFDVPRS